MPQHLTSLLSGRKFFYSATNDNSDMHRARRELDSHEFQIREGLEKKAGRPLTAREIRSQLGTRAIEASRAPLDPPPRNPFNARVAELERELSRTYDPRQRSAIEKRLFYARLSASDRAAEIGEHRAERSAEKSLQPLLETVSRQISTWATSDVAQENIDDLAAAITQARQTGDSDALAEKLAEVRGRVSAQREAKAEGLRMEIREKQSAIESLRKLDDAELRQVEGTNE